MIRHALLASVLLLPLTAGQALAVTAGVTAAVNQSAKSIPPGGGVRTIVLGDNVVQNETIETDGAGLVQILLADGTTFTVGPNSSLVIDRFVYDPNANTAQVAASLGRGVFRFIGGRTSKTEGGVQLNTPVGTVGIRGGMADLNFTGTGGNVAQIDLLFGNEVTLNGPNGGDRLFQPGYSIIIGPNGQPTVIKTPPGSANFIQQALAGRPGGNGGNSQQPDDEDVANSGVPGNNSNSNQPPNIPQPDLDAIDLATPKPNDINQVAQELGGQIKTKKGFSAGLFSATLPAGYVAAPLTDFNGDSRFQFNQNGNLVGAKFVVGLEEVAGSSVTFQEGSATLLTGSYPGAENFSVEIEDDPLLAVTDLFTVVTRSHESLVDCECVDWGYWSSDFDVPLQYSTPEPVQMRGTWIAGDIMTADQYDSFANQQPNAMAYYSGEVRGYGQYGTQSTIADSVKDGSGDFFMEWNFQTDLGTFQINDFTTADSDAYNHSFSADTAIGRGDMEAGYFTTTGPGTLTNVEHLAVSGAFFNNGTEPATGVLGSFNGLDIFDTNKVFSVTGVFAGESTENSIPPWSE